MVITKNKPIKLKTYMVIFTSIILVGIIILGSYFSYKANTIINHASQKAKVEASEEINSAVSRFWKLFDKSIIELANWQEAKRYFVEKEYYAYWKNTRLKNNRFLSGDGVLVIELLDTNKKFIDGNIDDFGYGIPTNINSYYVNPPEKDAKGVLKPHTTVISYLHPVYDDYGKDKIIGYILVVVDMNIALSDALYHRVDYKTICLGGEDNTTVGKTIHKTKMIKHIEYDIKQSGDITAMTDMLSAFSSQFLILFTIATVISFMMMRKMILNPISSLVSHLRTLGSDEKVCSYSGVMPIHELEEVRQAINEYHVNNVTLADSLDQKNGELYKLAHRDGLTGIRNRMAFDRDWNTMCDSIGDNRNNVVSLAIFDCDKFKRINDTFGHEIGDDVLLTVVDTVEKTLRKGDHLYRLGGDEFAVMFVNTDIEQATKVMKRCGLNISKVNPDTLGIDQNLQVSIGLSAVAGEIHISDLDRLKREADTAMYAAKGDVAEKTVVYTTGLQIVGK